MLDFRQSKVDLLQPIFANIRHSSDAREARAGAVAECSSHAINAASRPLNSRAVRSFSADSRRKVRMKYSELNLGQIEAIGNKLGGMTGIAQFLSGDLVVVAKTASNKLLEFVTAVTVPAVKRFAAADHFKHGETVDGVRVFLGDNFKKHFSGKVEKDVAGCDIRVHKLLRTSRDLPIRYELGEDNEETCLAHLWHFLKLQGDKGGWFIFYIRDFEGILWAVDAGWDGGGWCVVARSVEYCGGWDAGGSVCSR